MKKFLGRAVLGMILIYVINQYCVSQDISLYVGLNPLTFLISGALGLPGVALLYGIIAFQVF